MIYELFLSIMPVYCLALYSIMKSCLQRLFLSFLLKICKMYLINIWQMFNLDIGNLAVKPYIPYKSLFQWICCKCLAWYHRMKKNSLWPQKKNEVFLVFFVCVWLYGLPWPWPQIFFSEARRWFFWSYVITQEICNKFIEINFCFGCMVWSWLHLFQHWTFFKYWWDI